MSKENVETQPGATFFDGAEAYELYLSEESASQDCSGVPKRRTDDGNLAECPLCGSLDIGGAQDTVSCYGCGLQITKPRPLQNAIDAWNMRGGKSLNNVTP